MAGQSWSAGTYVNATYVHAKPYGTSGGSLRVHCASLMPKIGMGNPRITPTGLNKGIFRNAKDCAISVPSKISTQNYLTAKAPTGSFKLPLYDFGSTIQLEALDSDVQSARITINIDNSTLH